MWCLYAIYTASHTNPEKETRHCSCVMKSLWQQQNSAHQLKAKIYFLSHINNMACFYIYNFFPLIFLLLCWVALRAHYPIPNQICSKKDEKKSLTKSVYYCDVCAALKHCCASCYQNQFRTLVRPHNKTDIKISVN